METEIVRLARAWIGTPYVHQASVHGAGCDCLGLLRGVWREMGRGEPEALPNYAPDWGGAGREETLYRGLARHFAETPISGLNRAISRFFAWRPGRLPAIAESSPKPRAASPSSTPARTSG